MTRSDTERELAKTEFRAATIQKRSANALILVRMNEEIRRIFERVKSEPPKRKSDHPTK